MRRTSSQSGLSLVETVTAIIVLGIAIPPLIGLFTQAAQRSPDVAFQRAAVMHAENLMEEIASKAFEDPDLPSGSFGTEEGTRAAFDDIDDFDGLSNSPPQHLDGTLLDELGGFTRSVEVNNVTAADPDPLTPAPDGTTGFKRIRVRVAWTGARGGEVTTSTLRTRLTVSGPPPPTGGLDEPASQASALATSRRRFELDLVSISPGDLVLTSFALSSSAGPQELRRMQLAGNQIWRDNDVFTPTGTTPLNDGSTADRTVPAGASPALRVEFRNNQSGSIQYQLELAFSDGSSATLTFTIDW